MNVIIKKCWNRNKSTHIQGLVDGMEFYINENNSTPVSIPQDLKEEQIKDIVQTIYELREQEVLVELQ